MESSPQEKEKKEGRRQRVRSAAYIFVRHTNTDTGRDRKRRRLSSITMLLSALASNTTSAVATTRDHASSYLSSIKRGVTERAALDGRASRVLLLVVAAVLVAVYYRYYVKAPHELEVMQVRVEAFRPELLMEKQPIVIEDRVCDVRRLMNTSLRFWHLCSRTRTVPLPAARPLRTLAMATFITPRESGGAQLSGKAKHTVKAWSARHPQPVAFVLRAGQVLVLPPHWGACSGGGGVTGAASSSHDDDDTRKKKGPLFVVCEAYDVLHLLFWPMGAVRCSSSGKKSSAPSAPSVPSTSTPTRD